MVSRRKEEGGQRSSVNCQVTPEEPYPVWGTLLQGIYRPKGMCSKAWGGTELPGRQCLVSIIKCVSKVLREFFSWEVKPEDTTKLTQSARSRKQPCVFGSTRQASLGLNVSFGHFLWLEDYAFPGAEGNPLPFTVFKPHGQGLCGGDSSLRSEVMYIN